MYSKVSKIMLKLSRLKRPCWYFKMAYIGSWTRLLVYWVLSVNADDTTHFYGPYLTASFFCNSIDAGSTSPNRFGNSLPLRNEFTSKIFVIERPYSLMKQVSKMSVPPLPTEPPSLFLTQLILGFSH
jgi:hypothetical protein